MAEQSGASTAIYQTPINAALREYADGPRIEETLRRIIREELKEMIPESLPAARGSC